MSERKIEPRTPGGLSRLLRGRKIVAVRGEAFDAEPQTGAKAGVSLESFDLDDGTLVVVGVDELLGDYAVTLRFYPGRHGK